MSKVSYPEVTLLTEAAGMLPNADNSVSFSFLSCADNCDMQALHEHDCGIIVAATHAQEYTPDKT